MYGDNNLAMGEKGGELTPLPTAFMPRLFLCSRKGRGRAGFND